MNIERDYPMGSLPHLFRRLSQNDQRRQLLMRRLMPQLDEPRWQTDLRGDGRDGAREGALLQRIDEVVDEAHDGERVRLAEAG